MEPKDLITALIAVTGIVATAVAAERGRKQQRRSDEAQMETQARLHEEQLATQREQIAAQERQLREAADREHFRKLWDRRQASYLRIAIWVLEVQRSIESFGDGLEWEPPPTLPIESLAELLIYADYEVYAKSEFLRGYAEQTAQNLERFGKQLGIDRLREEKFLDTLREDARRLGFLVREYALRPPVWREPIALTDEPFAFVRPEEPL